MRKGFFLVAFTLCGLFLWGYASCFIAKAEAQPVDFVNRPFVVAVDSVVANTTPDSTDFPPDSITSSRTDTAGHWGPLGLPPSNCDPWLSRQLTLFLEIMDTCDADLAALEGMLAQRDKTIKEMKVVTYDLIMWIERLTAEVDSLEGLKGVDCVVVTTQRDSLLLVNADLHSTIADLQQAVAEEETHNENQRREFDQEREALIQQNTMLTEENNILQAEKTHLESLLKQVDGFVQTAHVFITSYFEATIQEAEADSLSE